MRTLIIAAMSMVLLSGCYYNAGLVESSPPTPIHTSANVAYIRAMQKITQLGYQVLSADRSSGFIRAQKEIPCVVLGFTVHYCHRYNVLAVTVVPAAADSARAIINVTPSTDMLPMDKKRRPDKLSASASWDAQQVIQAVEEGTKSLDRSAG